MGYEENPQARMDLDCFIEIISGGIALNDWVKKLPKKDLSTISTIVNGDAATKGSNLWEDDKDNFGGSVARGANRWWP